MPRPKPSALTGTAELNAMIERIAPSILELLADGLPRSKAAITEALASRHAEDDVELTLVRLAVTEKVSEIGSVIGVGGVLGVLALTAVANSTFLAGTQTQIQTATAINATATTTSIEAQQIATSSATSTTQSGIQQHTQVNASTKKADDRSNSRTYTNVSGHSVHAPAYDLDGDIPAGASARCRDGTYSFSQNHRGTCPHHDGVGEWMQ